MDIRFDGSAENGRCRTIGRRLAAVVVAGWLLGGVHLVAAQQDVATLVEKARSEFRPVTAEELAKARAELNERMHALERFVVPSSANGQRWLKFLKWEALQQALAGDGTPRLAPLDATLGKLYRNENGLELPKFRAVADAIQRYRDLVAVSQWPDPSALYGQQLDALTKALDAYRQNPTTENEVLLSNQLAVIRAVGQAPELVAAVRSEFDRPNAFIDVSGELLNAAAEPIHRSEAITDNILGTRIYGDADTTGQVKITTVPSTSAGVLELTSKGHSVSQNVGYNGPAVIHSTGYTDFVATKRVELLDEAFRSDPASASATNRSDIHSIGKCGGGLGSRLVSNIGWRRARQTKGRADAIAADHAEDRIERRINSEVGEKLSDARRRYEDEYRRPLERRGELPDDVRFSTTSDALSLQVTQAGRGQLATAAEPPSQPAGHDITMRIHESAVNNYTGALLGGATASQAEPDEDTKFDVKMPKFLEDLWKERKTDPAEAAAGREFKPWSLQFRQGRPISVGFAENRVKLTLHIERLQSGASEPFVHWDVWGTFVPEPSADGIVLRRVGELDANPTGLGDESLGGRRSAQKRNLLKEFNERSAEGRGFPSTIDFPEFKPEGALENAGPLRLRELVSENGWLTLMWDRADKDTAPAVASNSR